MIQVNNISKCFGQKKALDSVSLSIPDGIIYGLLGPNGAGKTTLIRILTGITMPDTGEALLDSHRITLNDARLIGYMPEERGLYKKMKVGEQLTYLARLRGMSSHEAEQEMNQWLQRFDISSWKYKKIEELSKGMAQKVQFISTVIHRPKILILDEPFSGFDPVNTQQIRNEIIALNQAGTTIILSTHNMESVESLCQQISLINHGQIVLQGEVAEIKDRFKDNIFTADLLQDGAVKHLSVRKQPDQTNNQLLEQLSLQGQILNFTEHKPSMNDIFIRVVTQK